MIIDQIMGRKPGKAVAAALLAGALVTIAPTGTLASARASSPGCFAWTGTQPPNVGTHNNVLAAAAVVSRCNAWAVGRYANGTADQTLIDHFNGASWKHIASPNPGGNSSTNVLNAVTATSASNAWAAGYYDTGNSTGGHALIEHWDGHAWQQAPLSGPSSSNIVLNGVTATSAANAWAVGYYSNGTAIQTLIEHWDGHAWKKVPSPDPAGPTRQNLLTSVTATSARDAWAVGDDFPGPELQTLILHWNGKTWKHVASPSRGGPSQLNILQGVAAASSTSAWAVGVYSLTRLPLIEHWNGKAWRIQKTPTPGGPLSENILTAVSAISSRNAWAVGGYFNGTRFVTLALHWNGTRWRQAASPSPGDAQTGDLLNGVAATSNSNLWAVGTQTASVAQTLAVHCC